MGEQSLGVPRAAAGMQCRALSGGAPWTVSSAAVAGQRSGALLRPPALEAMRRVEGFLPGGAVQVSSPAAEKASVPVLCREPGLTGSSSTTCIRDRVKQQIMLLKRTINRLLVVKEKAFKTENR